MAWAGSLHPDAGCMRSCANGVLPTAARVSITSPASSSPPFVRPSFCVSKGGYGTVKIDVTQIPRPTRPNHSRSCPSSR
eukprot:3557464-Prymnesium_polylepis.1